MDDVVDGDGTIVFRAALRSLPLEIIEHILSFAAEGWRDEDIHALRGIVSPGLPAPRGRVRDIARKRFLRRPWFTAFSGEELTSCILGEMDQQASVLSMDRGGSRSFEYHFLAVPRANDDTEAFPDQVRRRGLTTRWRMRCKSKALWKGNGCACHLKVTLQQSVFQRWYKVDVKTPTHDKTLHMSHNKLCRSGLSDFMPSGWRPCSLGIEWSIHDRAMFMSHILDACVRTALFVASFTISRRLEAVPGWALAWVRSKSGGPLLRLPFPPWECVADVVGNKERGAWNAAVLASGRQCIVFGEHAVSRRPDSNGDDDHCNVYLDPADSAVSLLRMVRWAARSAFRPDIECDPVWLKTQNRLFRGTNSQWMYEVCSQVDFDYVAPANNDDGLRAANGTEGL